MKNIILITVNQIVSMGKKHLKIIAITLVLLFLSCSCSQDINNSSTDSQQGFDGKKLIRLSSNSNPVKQNSPDTTDALMQDMYEFKSYTQVFFALWAAYIEEISPVLDYFNRKDISLEEKTEHAIILADAYRDFKYEIESLHPPEIALKAHNAAVNALTYRYLFFKAYASNATISELNELENNTYLEEVLFWEELDKIYKYFEEKADGEFDNNRNLLIDI